MQNSTKVFFPAILFFLSIFNSYAQNKLDTLDYLKANPNLYAIAISQNDQMVYEQYFNNHTSQSLFNDQSLTKSICSFLIGIAVEKGFIKSIDQKLSLYFPELNNDKDNRKKEITIRQVMNQASGLYHEDLRKLHKYLKLANPSEHTINAPLVSEPGKVFHYNNAASHLLSVILTKSTGMATHLFAEKYLFEPMGITGFEWSKMRDGYDDGSGLLSVRLRTADLLKIGSLLLHDGTYHHQQIIPKAWMQQTLSPPVFYQTTWGFDKSTYALCWYHTNYKGTPITYGMGWGGQFIVVVPSMKVVVAINQNTADATAIKQSNYFIEQIFPAIIELISKE